MTKCETDETLGIPKGGYEKAFEGPIFFNGRSHRDFY